MNNKLNDRELTEYLSTGIKNIISEVLMHTVKNPKETRFLLKYKISSKKAEQKRKKLEKTGHHIPAFLISSITNSCNLFCKGCYARENGICEQESGASLLTADNWGGIFSQAKDLGIGINLLAGGEPLYRKDVIILASKMKDILFPIFTNGTLIDNFYIDLFDENRNLIPVFSIEGNEKTTDKRRGPGIYESILQKMDQLKNRKILFGASVTATVENLNEIISNAFIEALARFGCRLIFYIEYVPIDEQTRELAFSQKERDQLKKALNSLRKLYPSVLLLSFPGDEEEMGGCLAAGRGFFHINPFGKAEACPFSPYSDCNLKSYTLLEALQSSFFKKLKQEGLTGGDHVGGCALFEQEEKVKELLRNI